MFVSARVLLRLHLMVDCPDMGVKSNSAAGLNAVALARLLYLLGLVVLLFSLSDFCILLAALAVQLILRAQTPYGIEARQREKKIGNFLAYPDSGSKTGDTMSPVCRYLILRIR